MARDPKVQGSKAHKSGARFERELDEFHKAYYAANGIADIVPHNKPTVPAIINGKRFARVVGNAPYDFDGVLGAPWYGWALAIEAKHTSSHARSLAISDKHAGLGVDQLDRLVGLWRDYGRLSLLVWRNKDEVGVMGPDDLERFSRAYKAGKVSRIDRDRFTWLPRNSMDYLEPILQRAQALRDLRDDWLY